MMQWYFYVGLLASALISIFTVPHLVHIKKTKNTAFINVWMYTIYLIGCFAFWLGGVLMVVSGNYNGGIPLIIAQSVCGVISTIIYITKLKNKRNAHKAGMTELDYCHQLKKFADEHNNKIRSLVLKGENKKEFNEENK